jgi:CheY-like chemotaxis protein
MVNPKRILLIEDDEHDQFFFAVAIHKIESASLYHIANNGLEALDKLKSSEDLPDLIITDIHMPVMDGIECLSEVKNIPHIRDIPVVVLSTDTSQIETVSKMGARAFVEKPGDTEVLQKLLEHILVMDFTAGGGISDQGFRAILSPHNL